MAPMRFVSCGKGRLCRSDAERGKFGKGKDAREAEREGERRRREKGRS